MGNSRSKKPIEQDCILDGTLKVEPLGQDELNILQSSFTYVKQNAHSVALKGVVRMVDTLPESGPALKLTGKNSGESYQLMNQGLIFITGIEKCIERISDPIKLRLYAKQLNAIHAKHSGLRPHHMVVGLKAFEGVIIDCLQAGYKHKRRASSVFFNTNNSTGSLMKLAQQPQNNKHSPMQPQPPSTPVANVDAASSTTVSLFGEEHTQCPICNAWKHFFEMLYVIFDPKLPASDDKTNTKTAIDSPDNNNHN